ncbi:hypothetical protein OJAV_G00087850 [Oryzias javanicus]|uniref:Leucine zipper tumor suppressor 3 n=1 Tax=Oryzias javanicus TaxID=123683 RepID=A0A437CZ85_ORYJA|nr:hypothetical protein OJAV_G00087850 [Oryzias javanicus]
MEREREREREREMHAAGLDVCGNIVGRGVSEKTSVGVNHHHNREMAAARTDSENNLASHNPPNHNPPKIMAVSGKLEQAMQSSSGLVRPSAFKPVVPKSFHSMQNLVGQAGGAGGEGKAEARGCGPPAVLGPLSASTSHINRLGMAGVAAGLDKLEKPGYQNGLSASDSGRSSSGKSSSSYQRLSHLSDAPGPLRPSPSSDDIIQDLEDRLWEKEQEVQHMRRNLDQSEAAIIQVFEEKQRVWERQMDELRQNYASRLQQVTRRAQRSQTALQAQITRLSQDKRRLQEEMAALLAQREELERKCLDYRKEQADILPRLEETKWEVCQKAGEISLLKQQLRESQAEVTQRAGEMVALRGQLKELNAQLREREEVMLGLKDSYSTKCLELEKCEGELRRTLSEVSILREKLGVFEAEVLSLKRALSEVSRGAEVVVSPNLAAAGLLPPWGAVHCPRNPTEPSTNSLTPTSDTLLSLQSDEAKAQRQEAQRQERQQREEAQWRDVQQQRQDAHMQQDIQMRQDAQIRPEAHLRQEAHLRHEPQIRQEAQLRHEAQMRQEAHLRHESQLCQDVQLRQDVHQPQRVQEGHWDEAGELRRQLEQLQAALRLERQQRERQALNFDQERHTWQDEKERVLKYQAQLQLSYVETLQKNQALEKHQKGPPSLHQLAPPWAGPSRLERIESTEI